MNKKRIKIILVITLMLIEVISISLTIKSFSNKPLNETKEENKIDKKQFSMYIENDTGEYTEYTTSELFPVGYTINLDKSNCVDTNGNLIDGILTGEDNKVTVTSNKTSYCYLYFDLIPTLSTMCNSGDNLGSCLTDNNSEIDSLNNSVEGGLYRYQGTNNVDNYICFGTTDRDECTSNTDAYMYRIIGVNESGQLKLIKKEALNEGVRWYTDYTTDITWPQSTVYSNINGSSFLTNTTYVPSGWSDKIATTSWKYGDNTTDDTTASELYDIENAWTDTVSAKVGLMYEHDYFYAYQSRGLNCSAFGGNSSTCKTSWMFLGICDSGAPSAYEWTMSRSGQHSNGSYRAWGVYSDGSVIRHALNNVYSIRPVFYLNADEIYTSGTGTIDDPIIISEPELTASETIMAMETTGLNTNLEGGLYRYQGTTADNYICFGTSDKDTCIGNTDAYMYRIIGINESGQMKLIKNEALNSAYAWSSNTNVMWDSASIYTNLNGSGFYSNSSYVSDLWKGKIAQSSWKYGDLISGTYDGLTAFETENAWTNVVNNYIGLMYVHDYLLAYPGGNPGSYSNAKTSWIYLNNCDSSITGASVEWIMPRSTYIRAWRISSGQLGDFTMSSPYLVRPVFFLESSVKYISGSGTVHDPFLIS